MADHRGIRTAAVVLVALVLGVVCVMVWHYLAGNELGEVGVIEARLVAPERLDLLVDTCHPPEVTLWERDVDLQVKAMSISPSSRVDVDCQFTVAFDLQTPLGDRAIFDVNTGQVVRVTTAR